MSATKFRAPARLAVLDDGAAQSPSQLTPEASASMTPLVLMCGPDAAQVLRRRSPPVWLQSYLGMVTTTTWGTRGQAGPATTTRRLAHHAPQWAWLDRTAALETMALRAKQGVSVIVAHVWVPVRAELGNPDVLELGQPRADLFKGLCWKLLTEDLMTSGGSGAGGEGGSGGAGTGAGLTGLVVSALRAEPGQDGFWLRHPARIAERYAGADLRGWREVLGRKWFPAAQPTNQRGPAEPTN